MKFLTKQFALRLILLVSLCIVTQAHRVGAEQLFQFANGMVVRGSMAKISTLKEGFGAAAAGEIQVMPIWMINDGLRRTYIHGNGMVKIAPVEVPELKKSIDLYQPKPLGGTQINGLGNLLSVSPFNDSGRRSVVVRGPSGAPLQIIQGIQELNARYATLVALNKKPSYVWDMRVATSSIDSATLNRIFKNRMDPENLDDRLEAVQFFTETKRYADAKAALKKVIKDFPSEKHLKPVLIQLTDRQAEQLLAEAKTRAGAGQYELARNILGGFPNESVGRVMKIEVQDALKEINDDDQQAVKMIEQLKTQVMSLNDAQAKSIQRILAEISAGLSADTLSRLSDFARLDSLTAENRVSLAISGWLLGSGQGIQNLSVAISLIEVRDLVAEYLRTTDQSRRDAILESLRNLEGAQPLYVDKMLPLLVPAVSWPAGAEMKTIGWDNDGRPVEGEVIPGCFGIDTGQAKYVIQLPPEYNPLREYPCVIALHESRSPIANQIDWWAGVYNSNSKTRRGHATRQGFIVVAPVWSRDGQLTYEYTPQEHQRVLTAMRDAMRRTSIDSDRVFITGQGEGGTAAWDIAIAHPDLWAGMISISGAPSKIVPHYEPNSRYVPLYVVMGQLDKTLTDRAIIDDYMSFNHDAMIVAYRGRGREYFYDEIHRLFEWMTTTTHRRSAIPQEIDAVTMREGDQFFWWLEVGDLNEGVAINPILWEDAKRLRAGKVTGSIGSENQIRLSGPAKEFTILLRPGMGIDLNEDVVIRKGSPKRFSFDGGLKTMLEDVRRRADRKRPFWMSISIP
ncbi:MAG: alpha/beta hydrolase [Rubripirellula sp.]